MKDPVLATITWLKADTAVAEIVGTRIYRAILPANPKWPAITVSGISPKRLNRTHNKSRTGQIRIQCTPWAESDGTAFKLSELIADSLDKIDNTYMAPGVFAVRIDDQGAIPDSNPDLGIWMYHRDFIVNYNV